MAINIYSKDSVDNLLSAKLSISSLSNAATSTLNATAPTTGQALTFDGTDLVWATVGGGGSFDGGTVTNAIVVDESATSGYSTTYAGAWISMAGGSMYVSQEEGLVSGFNIQLPVGGTITFGDGTTQTTAASYDAKKAIANLCASCLTTNGTTIGFTNYIAIAVIQGSKFQSGSNYLIGIGTPGGTPSTLTLTSSSVTYADAGMSWGSYYGQCVCYSDDGGSTWTYADLSF
jgi:hypothetical protein